MIARTLLIGTLLVLTLSGCVTDIPALIYGAVNEASRVVDTRGAWGTKTAKNMDKPITPKKMIKRGKTTRGEVLALLSVPEEKTDDGRLYLYNYEIQIIKERKKDKVVVERTPEGFWRDARFLVEFDPADVVKRYKWRECVSAKSMFVKVSFPECESQAQMCAMIKRLKDKHLMAQYCREDI